MAKNEKSVTDLVCEHIKKQKLLPIPVQTLNEEAEATRYFGGDLKEFLAAAKTLGAKGIFVETLYLEDDEFYYDSGIDDEEYLAMNGADASCACGCGENCECKKKDKKSKKGSTSSPTGKDDDKVDAVLLEPEDLDGLDLSLLRPGIAKFLDRIGECCGVRLTVPGVDHLEVEIFADWYDEFAELVDEASEIIEEDPNGALEEVEAKFKAAEAAAEAAEKDSGVKKIAVHPPKKAKKAK